MTTPNEAGALSEARGRPSYKSARFAPVPSELEEKMVGGRSDLLSDPFGFGYEFNRQDPDWGAAADHARRVLASMLLGEARPGAGKLEAGLTYIHRKSRSALPASARAFEHLEAELGFLERMEEEERERLLQQSMASDPPPGTEGIPARFLGQGLRRGE